MRRLWRWFLVVFVWRAATETEADGSERPPRIVPDGPPSPRAELVVVALLALAALSAVGFIVVYALDRLPDQPSTSVSRSAARSPSWPRRSSSPLTTSW